MTTMFHLRQFQEIPEKKITWITPYRSFEVQRDLPVNLNGVFYHTYLCSIRVAPYCSIMSKASPLLFTSVFLQSTSCFLLYVSLWFSVVLGRRRLKIVNSLNMGTNAIHFITWVLKKIICLHCLQALQLELY